MLAKASASSFFPSFIRCCSTTPFSGTADVVIIGGGIIGSSTAYWLSKEKPELRVVIVEKDLSFQFCSTTRSAASIRHQFSVKENIQISQFGTDFLRNIDTHLGIQGEADNIDAQFKENGYLFLASSTTESILEKNIALQKELACDISRMKAEELSQKFPWLTVDDISLGGFGNSGEGWFDPTIVMNAFRKKAQANGVVVQQGNVKMLLCDKNKVQTITYEDKNGKDHDIHCGNVVNASGAANGRKFASSIGRDIPVYAKKRSIFVFDCKDHNIEHCPLVVDPSGLYFRSEGNMFITGKCPDAADDPTVKPDDFEVDYDFFDETLWPLLASRVKQFEAIKVMGAWAGHYDHNLFDYNAIVGPDSRVKNFYFANGFSGHGLQQAPAIGRAISELIIHNKFQTLDLSRFSVERIAANEPIVEINVV